MMDKPRSVQSVLWIVLALNLAVTAVKLVVGVLSGALAIVADAFHSLVDSSTNIIGLVGVWAGARPADANHPYGHRKYETIAAFIIGGMLIVAGFEIGRDVVERLTGGATPPMITPLTFVVMALTLFVNLAIVAYETSAGKRLKSQVLLADAAHTRADLLVTLSVLASLAGTALGWAWLDPLVAGGVVVLLFRAAFSILWSTSQVLTDVAVVNPAQVERIAQSVPGVVGAGGVRSRGPAEAAYVDLSVVVDSTMTTTQAHNVASEVEQRIAHELPGVVETLVHVEPKDSAGTPWETMAHKLRSIADGLGLGLHDLHAHAEKGGGYSLEMHLEMDHALTLGDAHARTDEFEHRVREALPSVRALVTHMEPLHTHLPDEAGVIAHESALRRSIVAVADRVAGASSCHDVHLHNVGGRITATLHVTQPAGLPLTDAHALAETIEHTLHAQEPGLHRIVVHVEPPEE